MKRNQQQEVERIVNLWIDYVEVNEYNESIANMCERLQGKIHTYKGDLPQSGGYKPETVAAIAEKLKTVTTEQRWAKAILFSLHVDERMLITQWVQLKKKINKDTRQVFTMREVALIHGMKIEEYKQKREIACHHLLLVSCSMPYRKNWAA